MNEHQLAALLRLWFIYWDKNTSLEEAMEGFGQLDRIYQRNWIDLANGYIQQVETLTEENVAALLHYHFFFGYKPKADPIDAVMERFADMDPESQTFWLGEARRFMNEANNAQE